MTAGLLHREQIAVLLTSHNRQSHTTACLRSLRRQSAAAVSGVQLRVFLVDDGSIDGTAEAVVKIWPDATIIAGDGSLFWCGGMRKAWAAASLKDPGFYLLLNDDTILYPEALRHLLDLCPKTTSRTIAVGATCDPCSGNWTYGGLQCDTPFIPNGSQPRRCETMNANCALIPRAVFMEIGMFYHVYRHAMGDMDYGFSATKRGIEILETRAFVGTCSRNSICGTWRDTSLARTTRLKLLISTKGLPPHEWYHYCRRNYGVFWWRYFVSPYLRILIT